MGRIPSHSASVLVGKDSVISGEFFTVMKPTRWRADGTVPGLIYCPAAGQGGQGAKGFGPCAELARRGYAVIAGDVGSTPTAYLLSDGTPVFGNDASQTKLDTYRTYLQGTLGAKAGKIGLLYGSGGCPLAYNWAKNHPSDVYCIAGAIGACAVEWARSTGASRDINFAAQIEAAYTNLAGWQAAQATHDPIQHVSTLSAIPQLDYYGAIDNTVDDGAGTKHVEFAAAAGAAMTSVAMTGVGHSTLSLFGDPMLDAFCDWVEAHLV